MRNTEKEEPVLLTNGSKSSSDLTVLRDKHALVLSGKWEANYLPGFPFPSPNTFFFMKPPSLSLTLWF